MPQLLSLVGKAIGTILRAPSSNEPYGRNRSSNDCETGLDGPKRSRASAAGASAASEQSPRQPFSGKSEYRETLGASNSQGADLLSAASRDAGATGGSGRTSAGSGVAAIAAAAAAPVPVNCATSDASSHAGSTSPSAGPQFFRASRASLSDATASAAGEALRQASVTTCKHFTRENYNYYVRWVRASRGVMKIAGKMRSRVEATARNPNPQLLLRCEHWLEVTDEQHRYGSNLRVYFDYWVAEMEAAELTPPQSPALMSPSPSYSHLVALAQQHQQQQLQQLQLASAIASAAIAERTSPNQPMGSNRAAAERDQEQQDNEQQPRTATATAAAQDFNPRQSQPLPPVPQHQQLLLPQYEQEQQQQPAWAASCGGQGGAGYSPGPGPSRFSNDAGAAPRAGGSPEVRSHHHNQQHHEEQPLQLQQLPPLPPAQQQQDPQQQPRNGQLHHHRLHHHYHHIHHHHLHQPNPSAAPGQARDKHEPGPSQQQEDCEGAGEPTPTGDGALSSRSSRPLDDSQLLEQEAPAPPVGSQQEDGQQSQQHYRRRNEHHRHHHQHHHQHDHLELYEREGSVLGGADDGGGSPDSLPVSISVGRSHDGGGEPLSPHHAAARPRSHVRFVSGSCDTQSTLLQRRHLHQQVLLQQDQQLLPQQRRRSCGETDMAAVTRHPAAAQPRPSSDAASAMVSPPAQPLCSSPRRNVLCSPSRRFMMAAMIDMSPVEAEQSEQQQQQQQQGQEAARCQSEPSQEAGLLSRQLQQDALTGGGGGSAAAAGAAAATAPAQGSCGACAGAGDGGGAPPATPQSQGGAALPASLPPVTPAQNSCGVGGGGGVGGTAGNCTAQRIAKLLSSRASVGSGTSFFRWLDNGPGLEVDLVHLGVPRAKLDLERVKYLTPDELLEYELDVDIETGLLRYKRSGKLLHTGPDGRGSLDEHRRPPTPPPPAVPLALLGESAAAWWRGSGGAAVEPPPAPPPPSFTQPTPPLLQQWNPGAAAVAVRQAFRRMAAMGTVPEGVASGVDGEALRRSALAGDAAIEAATTAALAMMAVARGRGEESEGLGATSAEAVSARTGAAAASSLPDLELRGHSASSLARLERSRDAGYSAKDAAGVAVAGNGSGSSSGDGNSRPCSCTETGLMASAAPAEDAPSAAAAAAAVAFNISAGQARGGGGGGEGLVPTLAASLGGSPAGKGDEPTAEPADYGDMAAAAAVAKDAAAALNNQAEPVGAAVAARQLPVVKTTTTTSPMGRLATLTSGDGDAGGSTPSAAAAAASGAFASPIGGDVGAAGGMPRTPVAAAPAGGGGGGGGGYHHEAKVAKWIYVVDPELRLFVHPKVRGRFHHSSFLRGGAVVAAGGLAARHGRLHVLTADSGHYWPREENFRWLCEHLVYVGADLSACELKSKHMPVPAATGRELMEKMGVPPPWRLSYQPASSSSGAAAAAALGPQAGSELYGPPSPLAEDMHLLQLQDTEAELGGLGAVVSRFPASVFQWAEVGAAPEAKRS